MPPVAYNAQASGANNGTSWVDAYQTIVAAMAGAGTDGFIYADHTSVEAGASKTFSCDGQIIISVDASSGTFPPPAGTYLRGASIGSDAGDLNFVESGANRRGIQIYGLDLSVGDDFICNAYNLFFDDCSVTLTGAGDKLDIFGGATIFRDVTVIFGSTVSQIDMSDGNLKWKGGALSGAANNVIVGFGVPLDPHTFDIEGADFSTGANLCAVQGLGSSKAIFRGCTLKSGFTTHSGTLGKGALIALYGSHSSNIPYFIQEVHGQGSLITETTIVKDGGSSDGTTPISMKFVTGASAVETINPLRMELPISFYTETPGVQTFEVDVVTDGVKLQDDEAWLEASVPGTTIQRDLSNSLPTDIMTAPANLDASEAIWNDGTLGAPVKQKIQITVNVQQPGWLEFHICIARSSIEVYVDLKILDGARQFQIGRAYINGEDADFSVPTNPGDTVRQRIMDTIAVRLQSILVSNGYKTNAGQKVFAWREFGLGSTKLPALTYRDVDDDPDQETIGNVDNILTVEVQALTTQSATSDEQVREMLADVIVAVGADETWGDLAEFTLLPSSPMAVEQLEKKIFGAQIILVIEYQTARFNPYGR